MYVICIRNHDSTVSNDGSKGTQNRMKADSKKLSPKSTALTSAT